MRFFFYSHDGMGLGHVRRHIAIAAALHQADPKSQVLLANSVDEAASLGLPPNVDTLKLPGLRKVANAEYCSRRLNIPDVEIKHLRSNLLCEAVKSFSPDVVLADKHPFGAGNELASAVSAARSSGAKLVFGLRDVLDNPAVVLKEWSQERVQQRLCEQFDLVLAYGLRTVLDPVARYQLPEALAARTKYCGYVINPTATRCDDDCPNVTWTHFKDKPTVLCSAGGGEDGFKLLENFVRASLAASWKGVAITGPMLPINELHKLRTMAAGTGVVVQPFLPCLASHFWKTAVLVCMGGYNTVLEALSRGVPTVCVPRTTPRSEQMIRALAFQQLGLLQAISPDALTPEGLKNSIVAALELDREALRKSANAILGFNGAQNSAHYLLAPVGNCKRAAHSNHHSGKRAVPAVLSESAR